MFAQHSAARCSTKYLNKNFGRACWLRCLLAAQLPQASLVTQCISMNCINSFPVCLPPRTIHYLARVASSRSSGRRGADIRPDWQSRSRSDLYSAPPPAPTERAASATVLTSPATRASIALRTKHRMRRRPPMSHQSLDISRCQRGARSRAHDSRNAAGAFCAWEGLITTPSWALHNLGRRNYLASTVIFAKTVGALRCLN